MFIIYQTSLTRLVSGQAQHALHLGFSAETAGESEAAAATAAAASTEAETLEAALLPLAPIFEFSHFALNLRQSMTAAVKRR